MKTTRTTHCLLAIIALSLIWIALEPDHDVRGDTVSAQSPSASQKTNTDQEASLGVICTLSAVEPAVAETLLGGFQRQVVTTLNQTNSTLMSSNVSLEDIQGVLSRMEAELREIQKNTSPY